MADGVNGKRSLDLDVNSATYRAIILDIEGTTTPITFVKDILFPYVREHVESYLVDNWDTEECQQDIEALRVQAELDTDLEGAVSIPKSPDVEGKVDDELRKNIIASVVCSVQWLMDADRKVTALKKIQGHIWNQAYVSGEIKGKVYDDVLPALKQWTSSGTKVFIYSSGSVAAQKLLFKFSNQGNLLEFFSDHFDTKIGAKVECESYKKIAAKIEEDPSDILFITDIVKEAHAALEAGIRTVLSVRPGNAALTDQDKSTYTTITSFQELLQRDYNVMIQPKHQKT